MGWMGRGYMHLFLVLQYFEMLLGEQQLYSKVLWMFLADHIHGIILKKQTMLRSVKLMLKLEKNKDCH